MSLANIDKYTFVPLLACVGLLALVVSYCAISPKRPADQQTSSNWYLYGLVHQKDFDNFQQTLAPHKIKLVSRGCIVGGKVFEKEIKNNQRVYEFASDDLKRLLGKPRSYN